MSKHPVSDEIAGALAAYWYGGAGPSHSKLSAAFAAGGYSDADPYSPREGVPNKEQRVVTVISAAVRRPQTSRRLIEALLKALRDEGHFDQNRHGLFDEDKFKALLRAFHLSGWDLTTDGVLVPLGGIDLSTGGRAALDEQIARLRRSTDDPGAMLGSAKEILESTAKFVIEELDMPIERGGDFGKVLHSARKHLGVLPQQVDLTAPGAAAIQAILQSSWRIAEQVNVLRNDHGVGHGRTLPTGVTPELALLVVREACSVAEFMLTTLDRQMGRRA